MNESMNPGAVYVQTNDASANEVIAFSRDATGKLERLGTYATRGRGNGEPHLPSQGSLALALAGRFLLVTNTGSSDLSAFEISATGLALTDRVSTNGFAPTSVAAHGSLVYVLNRGGMGPGSVSGFTLSGSGALSMIEGSARPLSADNADGAQIAFSPDGQTLVATERVTDRVTTYAVAVDETLSGPVANPSAGATPYGFDFSADGVLVVTEAFGGQAGAAAASSYRLNGAPRLVPVSETVRNTRSEVCWAAVSKNGRYAYVTNFGDGTISSYTIAPDGSLALLQAIAATTREGEKGIRDESFTADGRFLYAIDADSQEIYGWSIDESGSLAPVGAVNGLPVTVAGLVAV